MIDYARRALRRLTDSWQDLLVVTALVALFVFVQRFPDGLDSGGDAVSKWQFARQWSYANDFRHATWNHHMTRMGVNAVAFLAQKLCGSGWRTYYVAPMFMGALQVVLVYVLGRRISGRLCGVLAGLAVMYLPATHTSVSQLLPDLFVGTYALLTTFLLARYREAAEARKLPWLLAAALSAFMAYLAKETAVFFYPGLGLAVLLLGRRWRDLFIFGGTQVLGLGLETLLYRTLTNYGSRLAVVRSVHFAGADADDPSELSLRGFAAIFRGLDSYWHYVLVAAALGAALLVVVNRRERATGRACVVIGVSQIALLSLSSQLWQNPLPRYMDPVIGLCSLCAAYFVATCALGLSRLPELVPPLRDRAAEWGRLLSNRYAALALTLLATLSLGWRTYRHQEASRPFDGRAHGAMLADLARNTYDRNLPLAHKSKRAKTLVAFYDVYLDPERLARNGVLPNLEDVRLRHREYTYLVKDPSVYDGRVFSELRSAGCVLEVRNIRRLPRIRNCADATRHTELAQHCDDLLRELTQTRK